ncbi:MAG: ATP-binding protein [Ruminococcus sp.]|nr:ATP-binding protein [Ruminococcus sp.]
MAKIYLMCGKLCSGKSTRAEQLRREHRAVLLSVDEITLALFGQDAGENHDTYVERAEDYLYKKSLEILEVGIDVVMDRGFWTKAERDFAREFYGSRGISWEFVFIDISDEEWDRRIDKRNSDTEAGRIDAYYVDEGLRRKFDGIFQRPGDDEIMSSERS